MLILYQSKEFALYIIVKGLFIVSHSNLKKTFLV